MTTSCFCADVPAGHRPYFKYFVEAFAIVGPSYGNHKVLYEFAGQIGGTCSWNPVVKQFGPGSIETLEKITIVDGGGNPIGYRLQLLFFDTSGGNNWLIDVLPPYSTDIPYPPQDAKSCSLYRWILPHSLLGPINPAVLTAAYPKRL